MLKIDIPRDVMQQQFDKLSNKRGDDECWIWGVTGRRDYEYGSFQYGGKTYRAHRISWALHFGEIGHKLVICHKCDVKGCVNPKHLFMGSQGDNMRDKWAKGRQGQPRAEEAK